jgi:Cysteine rich repeat
MFRIPFAALFALVAAQGVAMPSAWAQQGHDACARDVARFCRAHMNDDDQTVLACLKQHRTRLSKACDKILTDNGQ